MTGNPTLLLPWPAPKLHKSAGSHNIEAGLVALEHKACTAYLPGVLVCGDFVAQPLQVCVLLGAADKGIVLGHG